MSVAAWENRTICSAGSTNVASARIQVPGRLHIRKARSDKEFQLERGESGSQPTHANKMVFRHTVSACCNSLGSASFDTDSVIFNGPLHLCKAEAQIYIWDFIQWPRMQLWITLLKQLVAGRATLDLLSSKSMILPQTGPN